MTALQFNLPDFHQFTPEAAAQTVRATLQEYAGLVERVSNASTPDYAGLVEPIEHAGEALARAFGLISHLHNVVDSDAIRAVYTPLLAELTRFQTELMQNAALCAAFKRVAASPDFATLSAAQRRIVENWLRDFRLGGVDLEAAPRARFQAVEEELSQLSNEFSEAVMDATDAYSLPLSASQLGGLPDTALAILRQPDDSFVATLKFPSYNAILTYADDRTLREQLYRAYATRASELGADAAHDNSARVQQIMALRLEAAQLLGYNNPAEISLATKMAGTPVRVLKFLDDLRLKARAAGLADRDELAAFAQNQLGIADLQPWDLAYAAEKLKSLRFGIDDEALRPYFPLPHVLQGLFTVVQRLFGVRIVADPSVPTWHADVQYFRLEQDDRGAFAGFYFDPYARDKKQGGAWMDVCTARYRGTTAQAPVAYLVCNFAPPEASKPALLCHDDVVTLFHEFGHGLHHMLTEVDHASIAGVDGVEWDAVELPSQLMENFCWEPEGLALLAKHVDTGAALPADWVTQLRASQQFHGGMFLARQLEFALFDFTLHLAEQPADPLNVWRSTRRDVALFELPDYHRMPLSFSHIFAGGYAAGYYSYLWAEVLSADAFEAFRDDGLYSADVGARYREEILARGGSRPALESFIAFRGREPQIEPLLRSYGLAA